MNDIVYRDLRTKAERQLPIKKTWFAIAFFSVKKRGDSAVMESAIYIKKNTMECDCFIIYVLRILRALKRFYRIPPPPRLKHSPHDRIIKPDQYMCLLLFPFVDYHFLKLWYFPLILILFKIDYAKTSIYFFALTGYVVFQACLGNNGRCCCSPPLLGVTRMRCPRPLILLMNMSLHIFPLFTNLRYCAFVPLLILFELI